MRSISLAIVIIPALVLLVLQVAFGAETAQLQQRGGVVRLGPDFYLHENGKHLPIGIKSISLLDGCDLRVALVNDGDNRIVTAIADEDASLSSMGIMAGIYGGASSATVEMWKDGDKVCVTDPRFVGKNADIWLSFVVATS